VSGGGAVVLESKGYVIAAHQFKLSPQVGGEIVALDKRFMEGALYKKGDLLAVVDPELYEADVKSAEASLETAEGNALEVQVVWWSHKRGSAMSDIQAARADVAVARAKLRLSEIDRDNKISAGGGATEDDKAKARAQVISDEAALEAAIRRRDRLEDNRAERLRVYNAQIAKAEFDLKKARKQLKNCTIEAPVTGMVLSKNAELGAYVNPLAFNTAGYLCEMADLRDLEIELDIQERDIPRVKRGQQCLIMPEAYQRDEEFLRTHPNGYDGRVSRLIPQANRAKGAITVRVTVLLPKDEEPASYMRPDMGVLVSFLKP
jgi:multidrug resistance efflux pump